ncbi:MAG: hypothetical protein FWH47_07030 [Methanomassiliicoccaceae archaeon]|nr:hypothetical protein [Methanomassiliicoccaceae archaeon]
MFCPFCGSPLGNRPANFCPGCGRHIGRFIPPPSEWRPPAGIPDMGMAERGGRRNAAVAICVVLAMVLAAAGLGWGLGYDSGHDRVDIQTATEDTHFTLSGDFLLERGVFTVSLTDDGRIAFALNDDVSSRYDFYSWSFFDKDHVSSVSSGYYTRYTGAAPVNKAEPVLYYLSQDVGLYDISVKCYTGEEGQRTLSRTYSGTVGYVGTITKEYTWRYQGVLYHAEASFSYDDYRLYKEKDPRGRFLADYRKAASFVTYEDPAVVSLAESLRTAYGAAPGESGQGFAAFVLGFVQICIDYPPHNGLMTADMYQYGQDEYFAYPLETLFYGMGDCEDTSILLAALFKALGYGAALVMVPEHAVAAVALDSHAAGSYSARSYEVLSYEIDGLTYYACETTVASALGVGLVGSSSVDWDTYAKAEGKGRYGFYVV